MKKLLLVTALLALGATAFGEDKTSAPVRVRAELVSDSLSISDIDGRPLLLDFGKISLTQKSDANAFVDYKIEYSGTEGTEGQTRDLTLVLGQSTDAQTADEVTLTNIDTTKPNSTMKANLLLNTYEATVPANKTGIIHTGRVLGTLKEAQWNSKDAGVYEGQTELSITLADAK